MKRNREEISKIESCIINSSKKIHQILENDSPSKVYKGNYTTKRLSKSTEKFIQASENYSIQKKEKIKEFLRREKEQRKIKINSNSNHILLDKIYEKLAKRIENEDLDLTIKDDGKISDVFVMLNKYNIQDPNLLKIIFNLISRKNQEILEILNREGFLIANDPEMISGFITSFKKFMRLNKDFFGGLHKRDGSAQKEKSLEKSFEPTINPKSYLLSKNYFEKKVGDVERFNNHGELLYTMHRNSLKEKQEKSILSNLSKLETPNTSMRKKFSLANSLSRKMRTNDSIEKLYSLHSELIDKKTMKRVANGQEREHNMLKECTFQPKINSRNRSEGRRSCKDISGFAEFQERIKRANLKEAQKANAFMNLGKVKKSSKGNK